MDPSGSFKEDRTDDFHGIVTDNHCAIVAVDRSSLNRTVCDFRGLFL